MLLLPLIDHAPVGKESLPVSAPHAQLFQQM